MADFDKDFDFDEDSLREIESNEESLLFTQRDNIRIESSNENQSPPRNLEISSRKNLLLDIFESNKSVSDENISQDESSSRKNILLDLMSRSSPEPSPESPKERHPLRRILIDSFSKNTSRESTPDKLKKKLGFDRNSTSPFKRPMSPPKHVSPPKTLVRKFPGPAGLLSYSKSRSKNSSHRTMEVDFNETKARDSGFCSQETKKLFTDGAWRQMIDELPDDYLRGQNISSIKRPGRSNKIPVLAGIIHRIDWSADNPRVTLKDISDSVEGIMHKDIFTTYPNILQPGVVVLLRNVGILNVTGSKTPLTTSIVIISTDSIIAAYNDKSRIITTPELTKLMNRDYADSNQHDNYDDTENIDAIIDSDFEFDNNLIDDLAVEKTPALTNRAEEDNDLVREVNSVINRNEIAGSTFRDDLLNDSDDELMSQMDLNIADKSPDNRVTDQGNQPAADRDNFFELNNDDTFGDSDDEMLSQFDVDAVVKTYDAT